jgi:hypothetical protein
MEEAFEEEEKAERLEAQAEVSDPNYLANAVAAAASQPGGGGDAYMEIDGEGEADGVGEQDHTIDVDSKPHTNGTADDAVDQDDNEDS